MEIIELSRWPTLKIGKPEKVEVRAYILESGNIPDDILNLGKSLGHDLTQVSERGEIKWAKFENVPVLFLLIPQKMSGHLPTQRNLLNRLATKFSTNEFRTFKSCVLNVSSLKFKVECLESFLSGLYEFSVFKKDKIDIKDIWISGLSPEDEVKALGIANLFSWVCFARDLVNYPSSNKPPARLAGTICNQLKNLNIKTQIFTKDEVKRDFDPVWQVGKASNNRPVILRLEYKPENSKNSRPIVLIGKGIVYDVGGHNMKTYGPDLKIMKLDMAGAAAVAGICGSAASMALPVHLIAYLPIAENMMGANGLRPGDIVKIPSIKEPKEKDDWYSIEVTDTDAEGRLLLSSITNYASLNDNPELILTIATLCGSTEGMLGCLVAAAISKTRTLLDEIEASGRITSEFYATVRMPSDVVDEYLHDYESTVADFQNTNWDIPNGDTLQAFCLIQNFANKVPFLHLDICGTAYLPWAIVKRSKRTLPEGATGWGVASVIEFLRRYVKNGSSVEPA